MNRIQSAEHPIVNLLFMGVFCLGEIFAPSDCADNSGAANYLYLFDKSLPGPFAGGAPGEMTCGEEKEASNFKNNAEIFRRVMHRSS